MKRKEKLTTFVFILVALLVSLTVIGVILAYRTSEPQQNITFPSFTYKYEYSKQLLSDRDDNVTVTLINDGDVPLNISVWLEVPPTYSAKTCGRYAPYSANLDVMRNTTVQCTIRPNPGTAGTYPLTIHMSEPIYSLEKKQAINLVTCYGAPNASGHMELHC